MEIRNFCIIAHIDHGKSTLADRFLELTGTIQSREMKDQLLDTMDIERERGITIKLQPVKMNYQSRGQNYTLNLIDTPGHVDFTYEVSRSLQACEGALLLVDAVRGIQAQTLANAYLALEQNLTIIPIVNKIDLPGSTPEAAADELVKVFGFKREEVLFSSGKTGVGVKEILEAVIDRVPPAKQNNSGNTQALIFDSSYDPHRGVVAFVRVVSGAIEKNQRIHMLGTDTQGTALEVGFFSPKMVKSDSLHAGEVGYIVTGLRETAKARVGDTISLESEYKTTTPLPGYKHVQPMVYAGIFPISGDDYPVLRESLSKLKLSDSALSFEPENIPSLGFGFRCGFLGLLHMEIVQERLSREYDLDLTLTAPSVAYDIKFTDGTLVACHNPSEFPDPSKISQIFEPWVKLEILTPPSFIGAIMDLTTSRMGESVSMDYITQERTLLVFTIPLSSIIMDFFDTLKSVTQGYASMNYELIQSRPGDLVKVDILVAGEVVDALSLIVHRPIAVSEGRRMIEKLKTLIPKAQFEISLQAAIGGKIIARETISALRKDVTGYLYGGDVTRKMKLLNKQKKGKKRMRQIGKVSIPAEAFLAVLKR